MNLTFCVLTYNSSITLTAVIQRLMHQNVQPNIIIYDSASRDGTPEMVKAQIKNFYFEGAKIELIEDIRQNRGKQGNIAHSRYMVSQKVKTKYLMFVDSDILIPHYCVGKLMEEIEKPDVGMIGIRYEPTANHVMMGTALLRTEHARESRWRVVPKCDCSHLKDELEEKGLKVKYHDEFQAMHLSTFL